MVCGTTGESPTLTQKEKIQILDFVCSEVSGAVPIVFGSGSNSTIDSINLSKEAEKYPIEALLTVVPYYNKPPQEGLRLHFEAIANNSEKPILLYNVPGRTITALEPETIIQLSQHSNICGIKEANSDINNFSKYKNSVPDDFSLLSGDDESCVGFCLLGGHGVISVCSHIAPKRMVGWIDRALKRDESVRTEFRQQGTWIQKLYMKSNPIPIKAALELKGIIASRDLRLPLLGLNDKDMEELTYILKEFSGTL